MLIDDLKARIAQVVLAALCGVVEEQVGGAIHYNHLLVYGASVHTWVESAAFSHVVGEEAVSWAFERPSYHHSHSPLFLIFLFIKHTRYLIQEVYFLIILSDWKIFKDFIYVLIRLKREQNRSRFRLKELFFWIRIQTLKFLNKHQIKYFEFIFKRKKINIYD